MMMAEGVIDFYYIRYPHNQLPKQLMKQCQDILSSKHINMYGQLYEMELTEHNAVQFAEDHPFDTISVQAAQAAKVITSVCSVSCYASEYLVTKPNIYLYNACSYYVAYTVQLATDLIDTESMIAYLIPEIIDYAIKNEVRMFSGIGDFSKFFDTLSPELKDKVVYNINLFG